MVLRWLRIQNFRSIEDMEISFMQPGRRTRKWSLLLSENGVGKTTVLRALALLTAGSDALGTLLTDVDSWIRHGHEEARLEAFLTSERGLPDHISLVLRRHDTLAKVLSRNAASLEILDRSLSRAYRRHFVVGYGVPRRGAHAQRTRIPTDLIVGQAPGTRPRRWAPCFPATVPCCRWRPGS